MTIGRVYHWSLTLTVVVALLGMLNGSVLIAVATVVALVCVLGASRWLQRPRRPLWLSVFVHGATVLGLVFALSVFRNARIDAVLIVVMLGVVNRYVLRAGHRDDLILVGASTVLLAANTTITPGVAFLFLLLAFIPLVFWALWAATLLDAAPDRRNDIAPKQMRALAVWGLTLTLCGFLAVSLLPRYRLGHLLTAGYFMQLAGATSEMTLTTGGVQPPTGGTPVMQVELRPGSASGRVEGLYARISVLDTFDGQKFSQSSSGRLLPVYKLGEQFRGEHREFLDTDSPGTVRVTMERMERRGRFHPIATLGRAGPSYVMMPTLQQMENGVWGSAARKAQANIVYKVDLDRPAPIARWARFERSRVEDRLLQLPDGIDPRVRDLAARLTATQGSTRDKVRAILGHFERGYDYSLDPLEGESDDPLVRFIFEAKKGHCELYAAAVTVLLRLAGVKARVATGYYGGWWNDAGAYLEFTSTDAHAWVEVFDDVDGWFWVDATPASERMRGKGRTFAWVVDLYNAVEKLWYDRVVDFDEAKRQRLVNDVKETVSAIATPNASGGSGGSGAPGLIALVVVAFAPIGLGVFYFRRTRRRPRALGIRLRRALGDDGKANVTLGVLLKAAKRVPEATAAVRRYEAWRFGAAGSNEDVDAVLDAIRALERAPKD